MNQYDGLVLDKETDQKLPKKEVEIDLELASNINNCGDCTYEED